MYIQESLILHPYIALIPAIIFGIIYYRLRKKILGFTASTWILYFIYETLNLLRITCSGDCGIRADLVLIYPLLIILTMVSIVQTVKNLPLKNK